MKVLVTGGTGFIGHHLLKVLLSKGVDVRVLSRRADSSGLRWPSRIPVVTGDLTSSRSLTGIADGVETVYHLASLNHAYDVNDATLEEIHRRVTVEGTRHLLNEAIQAGVRRFVFASSVKAMGEGMEGCLDETSPAAPITAYGIAKREAEELVLEKGRECGMHVCVLRLPLVYGPGNKGNIPRMIEAIDRGIFPPIPKVGNSRSMVHVEDVVQALLLASECPAANGKIYLVTDGRVYSTREIYKAILKALGRDVPWWTVPIWALRWGARIADAVLQMAGRSRPSCAAEVEKLLCSAWYDPSRICNELGFEPRHTLFDALAEMVADYRADRTAKTSKSDPAQKARDAKREIFWE